MDLFLRLLIVSTALLGAAVGALHHDSMSITLFLAAWSALPTTTAWGGAALLGKRSHVQRAPCRFGGLVSGGLGTIALSVRVLCGQPPAEGAAHLGPFIWPVMFGMVGLVTYVMASWFGRYRTPPNKRLEPTRLDVTRPRDLECAGGSSARR
jgi:hypothetical protein